MSNWTPQEIEKTINEIKKIASLDEDFRNLCLSDFNEAVKQVAGKKIPTGVKISVLEANPNFDQTLVLPPLVSASLSDNDLDQVAGGRRGDARSSSETSAK
jgi:hypothetical protein